MLDSGVHGSKAAKIHIHPFNRINIHFGTLVSGHSQQFISWYKHCNDSCNCEENTGTNAAVQWQMGGIPHARIRMLLLIKLR